MVAGGAVGLTAAFEVEGADDGGEELALTGAEAAAGTAAGATAAAGTLVFEVLAAWVLLEWRTHREIPKPATRAAARTIRHGVPLELWLRNSFRAGWTSCARGSCRSGSSSISAGAGALPLAAFAAALGASFDPPFPLLPERTAEGGWGSQTSCASIWACRSDAR